MKSLLNNKNFVCIPTLFHQNTYVTEFRKKSGLFNCFFAKQCFIINNSSELLFNLFKKADKSILTITFTSNDIVKIIQKLGSNKAQGHHMLSIRIMKLCGEWICKPFGLKFQFCIKHSKFPTEWKKANVVSVHKNVANKF